MKLANTRWTMSFQKRFLVHFTFVEDLYLLHKNEIFIKIEYVYEMYITYIITFLVSYRTYRSHVFVKLGINEKKDATIFCFFKIFCLNSRSYFSIKYFFMSKRTLQANLTCPYDNTIKQNVLKVKFNISKK